MNIRTTIGMIDVDNMFHALTENAVAATTIKHAIKDRYVNTIEVNIAVEIALKLLEDKVTTKEEPTQLSLFEEPARLSLKSAKPHALGLLFDAFTRDYLAKKKFPQSGDRAGRSAGKMMEKSKWK
jgi:hypothetical protein